MNGFDNSLGWGTLSLNGYDDPLGCGALSLNDYDDSLGCDALSLNGYDNLVIVLLSPRTVMIILCVVALTLQAVAVNEQ